MSMAVMVCAQPQRPAGLVEHGSWCWRVCDTPAVAGVSAGVWTPTARCARERAVVRGGCSACCVAGVGVVRALH